MGTAMGKTAGCQPFLSEPLPVVGQQHQRVCFSASSSYDYKVLRDMLVASFKIQFDLQQIYWPTRFSSFARTMFPLARISQRVSMEVFNALYGQ
jgi:hypothetical protein